MKTFQRFSADTRLTDELERQLLQEALRAQEGPDVASDLRHAANFVVQKVAGLLNTPRKVKGLPGEYLYS
jgi:hypothetical protein